jgi:carotenoid phi-ring synthase / carotenoid chi-ring synthase
VRVLLADVLRPGVATPLAALALAGDGIRIDLPVALVERAATGWAAANLLLGHWGLAGHPLYTVPTRGRSAMVVRRPGSWRENRGATGLLLIFDSGR